MLYYFNVNLVLYEELRMATFTNYTYCSGCAEMTLNHNSTCPNCGCEDVSHHTMDVDPADVILGDNDIIRWELMHESDMCENIEDYEEELEYYDEYLEEEDKPRIERKKK